MYRVLLALDDDTDRAREKAAFVAGLPGHDQIEVLLTHSLTATEREAGQQVPIDRIETVRLARDELAEQGLAVDAAEARNPPAEGILELAREWGADHIVMGSRKRSPTGKAVFGSVVQTVLLEADVPVTVVGDRET